MEVSCRDPPTGLRTARALQAWSAGIVVRRLTLAKKQGLNGVSKRPVTMVFTPHLTPMIRGIHATLYARLTQPDVDLQHLYETRFAGEPFVDVMPPGSHPDTRSVRASNICRIAVHRPQGGDTAVILAVVDNLVKGAAGQAVQNMNLMFGLPETTGLLAPPVLP